MRRAARCATARVKCLVLWVSTQSGLLAIADSVEKLTGVCMVCGSDAGYISYRLVSDDRQLVVGDVGEYQVRCRNCYEPPKKRT